MSIPTRVRRGIPVALTSDFSMLGIDTTTRQGSRIECRSSNLEGTTWPVRFLERTETSIIDAEVPRTPSRKFSNVRTTRAFAPALSPGGFIGGDFHFHRLGD